MFCRTRERFCELMKSRAVLRGQFTLASGRQSSYYIDSKRVLLHAEGIALAGKLIWGLTRHLSVQAVGGLEMGAAPIAVATALHYHRKKRPLEAFLVRKHAKEHGSQQRLEGLVRPGYRVVVVEDVLTTGDSALQAATVVEEQGAQVVAVIALVDRLEGGAGRIEARYHYLSVLTLHDLGLELPSV